jgi:hypothetical protein
VVFNRRQQSQRSLRGVSVDPGDTLLPFEPAYELGMEGTISPGRTSRLEMHYARYIYYEIIYQHVSFFVLTRGQPLR